MKYLNEKPLVTHIETNWNNRVMMYMQNDMSTSSNDYMYIFNAWGITTFPVKEKIKKQPRGNKGGGANRFNRFGIGHLLRSVNADFN